MRVVTLVGARPQFIKASMMSRALARNAVEEVLIHSGQHYDAKVSQVFFDELELPRPYRNLHVGSGSHATQTGQIMIDFEKLLLELPTIDWVIVYGDTNTTVAGALVAAKLNIPVAHIEAGLRSFNRSMPEEINRIITDRISDILFCPTVTSIDNLANEGMTDHVYLAGDVMYDATVHFSEMAKQKLSLPQLTPHAPGGYYLATIHRASNTDDPEKLSEIMRGLGMLDLPVVLPLHPRTKARIQPAMIGSNINLCEPVGYLEMLMLVQHAKAVITDSGGLQKEAYWLKTPCMTVRSETEWIETLENGWNHLVAAEADAILSATAHLADSNTPQSLFGLPAEYTSASAFMAQKLIAHAA